MKNPATSILETIGSTLWGFRPALMRDIVTIHGGKKSLRWFVSNMPRYEKTLKRWGPERTHLMAVAISGINGCPYCTYGHALAFQLHYFKNRNELFVLDETAMMNFHTLTQEQVVDSLSRAYGATDLSQERKDLERMVELKNSPELAQTDDDRKIAHMIDMFAFLNQCGIEKNTAADHAHDPINKDAELVKDYTAIRKAVSVN